MKNFKKLGVLLGVLPLLVASTAFAGTSDYVNYWTMNEGMGRSVNDSVGGQNGVMTGSSTGFGWASGKVGTAIGMDGTDGTGIVLPDGILKGSQGTISLWLNAQSLKYGNIIFSGKSTIENNIYTALFVDNEGRLTFQHRDSVNGTDDKAQGSKILNKNEWYNVVFTANAQGYRMFVNGEEMNVAGNNTGRWMPDLTNHTLSYRIGSLSATPLSGSWNGYLDDVRIYARALTQEDVTALYNEGNAAKMTVPAAVAPKGTLVLSEDHVPFGGSVKVSWTSVNTDSCSGSDGLVGATTTSGSMVFIKLSQDTSYTLTCSNAKYGSDTSTVKVVVGGATPVVSTSTINVIALPPTASATAVAKTYFAHNLTIGSRGDEVKQLQELLIAKGYLKGTATGYFGGLTKAGLMKLQKEYGLPSTGYFGPMSRTKLNPTN